MKLWTVQMAQWRLAKERGIPLIDSTVKSGKPWLAPLWDMVMGHKNGTLSNEAYTTQYNAMMLKSMRDNPQEWSELIAMDEVAIACYCQAGCFCHRRLLVPLIGAFCIGNKIPFEYLGELIKE